MVECPKCKKNIKYLLVVATDVMEYKVRPTKDGLLAWYRNTLIDSEYEEFQCPHCGFVVARTPTEVVQFFRSEEK